MGLRANEDGLHQPGNVGVCAVPSRSFAAKVLPSFQLQKAWQLIRHKSCPLEFEWTTGRLFLRP